MDKEVICKEVIITTQTCRGSGNVDDPIRRITQVFEKDGTFIAEHDSFRDVQYYIPAFMVLRTDQVPDKLRPSNFDIMDDFNAQQAKNIVNSMVNNELHKILVDIKNTAQKGETALFICHKLSKKTINELKDRGFAVINNSPPDKPKFHRHPMSQHYTIFWV